MCTIVLYQNVSAEYPLIIASNRDERYARPSSPPSVLGERPRIIGGSDIKAGGTWMGVNQFGLWVGIANRAAAALPDPRRRSRGLLCIDLLRDKSSRHVLSKLSKINLDNYNPLILAVADRESGFAVSNGTDRDPRIIEPGFHVLTNAGFDQDGDPRREGVRKRLLAQTATGPMPTAQVLAGLMKDHGEHGTEALCIHGDGGGTRSSTILALHENLADSRYYYADGPPCRTGYSDYSFLFSEGTATDPGVTKGWGTDILS